MDIYKRVQFHPFFQGMDLKSKIDMIDSCHFKQYEKGDIIFGADMQREGLLLLLSGACEVFVKSGQHYEVLEVVQKGEITGFSSLAEFLGAARDTQMIEVRATEQTEALHIPFQAISKVWDHDPNIRDYLLTQISIRLKDIYTSLAEQVKLSRQFGEIAPLVIRIADIMTTDIQSIHPNQTIKELTTQMIKHHTSSVLVIEDQKLVGIVTERDLVKRVIAKSLSYESCAADIMSQQPITISRNAFYYDALSLILLKGVKHLPVVDGEQVVGILTLSDLLRKKNDNMVRIIQQIESAEEEHLPKIKEAIYSILETFLADRAPILKTLEVVTELYDRLVTRCVELAQLNLKEVPPGKFCLYQMGSSGRGEQFLLTDQDHFLVYENGCEDAYFKKLAIELVRLLGMAGYAPCIGNMMSSADNWRGTVSRFESRIREWCIQATNDNLLLAQNFFSYRLVYGSSQLHHLFEEKMTHVLNRSKIFLYRLTQVEKENQIPTLEQPIRSLFRLARRQIDIKKEILFPFHHSLQILSLFHGNLSGTPLERLEVLKSKDVLSDDFAKDVKTAISGILKLYVKQRFNQYKQQEPSTSILHFTHLTTREKEELILSLKTLRELQGYAFALFSI